MPRKTKLTELNPRWAKFYADKDGSPDALSFDCPEEGHDDCRYVIPFAPALDGGPSKLPEGRTKWDRTGNTFETVTLSPSIRGIPQYASKEAAEKALGERMKYAHPRMWCALHIFIKNGQIEFCGDSK